MCKGKILKKIIGTVLTLALILSSVIVPLQTALFVKAEGGETLIKNASFGLPEISNTAGKTLEFDLDKKLQETETVQFGLFCEIKTAGRIGLFNANRINDGSINDAPIITVVDNGDGWYHYTVFLNFYTNCSESKPIKNLVVMNVLQGLQVKIKNITIGTDVYSLPEEFAKADTVTLADLDLLGYNFETPVSSGTYKYDGKSATNSVIVKFGWDANFSDEDSGWKLALDTYWNSSCMVWFKSDHIHFCIGLDDLKCTLDPITSGRHEVEFGRLRVTAGPNYGKDYVYLKIDGGEPVAEGYTNHYQTPGGYLAYNDQYVEPNYTVHFVNDDPNGTGVDHVKEQGFSGFIDKSLYGEDEFTTDYKTVTLADFGLFGTDYVTKLESGTYEYEGDSKTHSVVVKLGWDANITDDIDWKLALDTYWNTNCMVWFRPNKIYFCPGQGTFTDLNAEATPITSGKHDIEFGRLRVTGGYYEGKDYVFLKVDGSVVASKYTDHYQTEGGYLAYYSDGVAKYTQPNNTVHFVNDGVLEQGFSGFKNPDDYETDVFTKDFDTVTLKTLGLVGTDFKTPVKSGTYEYKGKSSTHSVKVKFKWKPNFNDGNNSWKLALDTYWNAFCMVWFQNDRIYFCPGEQNTILQTEIKKAYTDGIHDVEFGRLRVTEGHNKGKDRVYLIIDGELIAEKFTDYYQTNGGYVAYYSGDPKTPKYTQPNYSVHFVDDGVEKQGFSGFMNPADYETDVFTEDYDTVTLESLGLIGTDFKTTVQSGSYNYEGTSKTNSVKVKFKWEPNFNSGNNSWKVALDTYWNSYCMVWFQKDRIYFCPGEQNAILKVEINKSFTSGRHDVEFGRLRVTKGHNKGKDRVYLIIDGELVAEKFTDYYQTSGGYLAYNDKYTKPNYSVHFVDPGVSKQGFSGFMDPNKYGPEEYVTDYDTVTLADLGLLGTDYVTPVQSGSYKYNGKSSTNSVVVKFGWKPNYSETDEWKIALDTYWNSNCMVWFKADKIYFCPGAYGKFTELSVTTDPITSGEHAVEFGRLRVTKGYNKGKDYVFLKIDGNVIASKYTTHYQTPGGYFAYTSDKGDNYTERNYTVHFVTNGVSKQVFSGFIDPKQYGPETYTEDCDVITLADLRITGTDYQTPVQSGSYTYNGKSSTNSVIVKFGWEPNFNETDEWKIALDTYWNSNCMVWFKSDKIYFCPGADGKFTELKVEADPITSGRHDVEFGRLRVTGGYYEGKDYVFLKIDGKLIAGKYTDHYQTSGGYLAYNDKYTVPSYTVHFVTDGVSKQRFSGFAEPDKYTSDIDYLNIGDIVPDGVVKDTIHDGYLGYTYPVTLSSKTNSTVVKYVVKTGNFKNAAMDGSVMVVDIGGNCGFCRAYIRQGVKDEIMFGWEIDGCTSGTKKYTFESNSWYAFEQGRIRVIGGINEGKDYVYLKINGELVSYFYGEPESRPMAGQQIYVEATENIQVIAYNELRVKYYVDDELYLDQLAQKGFNVIKPSDPKKEGHYFVGWYTEKNGGSLFDFENTKLNENINLYARFTTETVQVTFNPNNGEDSYTVTSGKNCLVPVPREPSSYKKDGFEYVFIGWKNDSTGKMWDFENDRLSENATFTAQYKEKEYYVSYYANGKLVKTVPFVLSNPTISGKVPAVPEIPNTTGAWEEHSVSGLTKSITVNAVYKVKVPTASSAVKLSEHTRIYLNTDLVHDYLSTDISKQTAYVREYNSAPHEYQDHQNTTFKWTDDGKNSSYTVYFADNKDFKNAYIVTTNETSLINQVGIFTPGETYYWFVYGNDTGKSSEVDSFNVVNTPVRYITAGKVTNMRDEGGYMTTDGSKVKYGMVYRGASLDEYHSHLDDVARYVFNYLGMKSEIELRGGMQHEYTGWDENNPNVYYISAVAYESILTLSDDLKGQYKQTFEAMADKNNYPFYFHCSAGADRTGAFGYVLNGLLGVPYENLREDYELTSFSEVGLRTADNFSDGSMDNLNKLMLEQYGDGTGNLQVAIENYLKNYIGLSDATLDSIKDILLDKDPTPNEKPHTITIDVLGKKYTYEAFEGIYFMPKAPQAMGKLFLGFYDGDVKYDGYAKGSLNLKAKFEDIIFEPYDTISLADLGIKENKILNQTNAVYTYEKMAQSGGRLLQFILEPIGNMNNGDGPQVALTNDWSINSFARAWFQNNTMSQIYYSGVLGSGPDISKMISLESGKQYDIQFAVRVMKNKGYKGQKVFEVTINGELLVQYIGCNADLSQNLIFFHGGTGSAYLINKPVYHTVEFYDGDKLLSSVEVLRGTTVKSHGKLGDKGEKVFKGWYTEYGQEWNFEVDRIYSDTVFKAKFQKRTYPVLLMVDGILYKRLNVIVGETADIFDVPTKDGFEFDKWLNEDGTEYDMKTPVNAPVTLFASFKKSKVENLAQIGNIKPNDKNETNSSNLKYIIFTIIGLAGIAAETGVITYKKRLKR